MLYGRYQTFWLSSHWTRSLLALAVSPSVVLTQLQILSPTSCLSVKIWAQPDRGYSPSSQTTSRISPPPPNHYEVYCLRHPSPNLQFLLDCTVLPDVISLSQIHGKLVHDSLLYLTRTLSFSVHKAQLKLLGKWNLRNQTTDNLYNI